MFKEGLFCEIQNSLLRRVTSLDIEINKIAVGEKNIGIVEPQQCLLQNQIVLFYVKDNGRSVNRLPVNLRTALATAAPIGPIGGSPTG